MTKSMRLGGNMTNFIGRSIILCYLLSWACYVPPKKLEPSKRYAVEYFDACPTFDILFIDKEIIALISDTKETITFTSYEPHGISFRRYYYIDVIKLNLKKINKTIPEIKVIIHNHFNNPYFSPNDIHLLNRMKLHGFRGIFAIYFVPLKIVMTYTEKKNKK